MFYTFAWEKLPVAFRVVPNQRNHIYDVTFLHPLPFEDALAERGITAWYDTQDIDKGTYWTESIAVAIKDCKVPYFPPSHIYPCFNLLFFSSQGFRFSYE